MQEKKTAFVIMKERSSPIMFCQSEPHEVHTDRKSAIDRATKLNKAAARNTYYVRKVAMATGEAK